MNNSSAIDFLIVGLGNPGIKYSFNRHNAGFLAIDMFAHEHNFEIKSLKFHALVADKRIGGKRCLFLKPQTFMNLSGQAVKECANFYHIPIENIVVLFDDINGEVGNIRIKRKGSAGGHNGIKSIISSMGSSDFARIKIGVGNKPHPDYELADWVLSSFSKDELRPLRQACLDACDALELMIDGNIDEAMNKFSH